MTWEELPFEYPKDNEIVIVAGGIAFWDGKQWYSCTEYSRRRPIEWDVKWWRKLPTYDEHLRLHTLDERVKKFEEVARSILRNPGSSSLDSAKRLLRDAMGEK